MNIRKHHRWGSIVLTLVCATSILCHTSLVIGRGGRGGGGGGGGRVGGGGGGNFGGGGGRVGGGGGGGFQGAAPRPAAPSRPSMGSAPSFGGGRPNVAPGGGASRPNVGPGGGGRPSIGTLPSSPNLGGGNRPSLQPGNGRPGIGNGPSVGGGVGGRPGLDGRPGIGNQPGIGNRPGVGNGPGIGNGPIGGNRPGGDQRPGFANRPNNTLPGLSNRFPNASDRMADRGQNIQDRHQNLQDRLQNRGDRQDDRQDWRNQNREDWQDWANNYHDDWYHGAGSWWNHAWDNYPGLMAFGVTTWGLNRLAYGFGLGAYSNPYYSDGGGGGGGYDYSQPIMETPVASDPSATAGTTSAAAAGPTPAALSSFDQARTAFYTGDLATALTSIDQTIKEFPNDAVAHEFRSLVLFGLGKYSQAAATIHPVLAVGPGWDWPTLVSLYPSVDVYTQQLRGLEQYVKANAQAADARFLLGYHYLTCDHKDAANKMFAKAAALNPNDKIAAEYAQLTESAASQKPDQPRPNPPPTASIPADQLIAKKDVVGIWKSNGGNGTAFTLELTDGDTFTWSFTQGQKSQSIKGVYALDQNTLALQPDSGGTMLADLSRKGSGLHFAMQGAPKNDPGLDFNR